jgi:F-type H+-transporting ATPase subunit alpha
MSSILEEIETQIAGLKTSTQKSNIGIVRAAGDGVARVEGLSEVMLNEMIEFPSGEFGLALNLEETEVGVILLGDPTRVAEGDEVKDDRQELLQVPVGKALLGRVVNTLGQPIDNKADSHRLILCGGKIAPAHRSDALSVNRGRPASCDRCHDSDRSRQRE